MQKFYVETLTGKNTTTRKSSVDERLQDIITTLFPSQYVDLRTVIVLAQLLAATTFCRTLLPVLDPPINTLRIKMLESSTKK